MLENVPTSELADFLDVNDSFVSNIKAGRKQMPAKRCRAVSERFGIPLHELRPDIFGDPESATPPTDRENAA